MPTLPARVVLAILAFFLFLVAQMSRVNINIAIVTMEDKFLSNGWDAKVIVLGAFYWCYSLIELPSTLVVRKYGCRNILMVCVLVSGLGNFVFPMAYTYHPVCGIIIRALQGLFLGVTWPAIAVMSSKWIPLHERSKFSSTYQGSSVGTSVTYAISGIIIYNFGWPYIFHVTGILSIIWSVFWWLYAYDSPSEHPSISETEKLYLENSICHTQYVKQSIPWREIWTSKAFWAVFIGTFAIMWFVVTIAMQLPTYLHAVHEVNIRTNGLLLCIPDICTFLFSFSFSVITDKIIKSKTMSITNARKFAFIFSHIIPAILLIILGVYGSQNITVAMILIIIAVASGGATSSGNLANIVDISPNNAGIIMGISKSMCIFPGILSPIIVKHFTSNDPHNWLPVFFISTVILVFCSIVYFIFGSGQAQNWNQKSRTNDVDLKVIEKDKLLNEEKKIAIVVKKSAT